MGQRMHAGTLGWTPLREHSFVVSARTAAQSDYSPPNLCISPLLSPLFTPLFFFSLQIKGNRSMLMRLKK